MLKSTLVSICGHLLVVGACLLIGYMLPEKNVPCFVDLTLISLQAMQENDEITDKITEIKQQKQKKQDEIEDVIQERTENENHDQSEHFADTIVQRLPDSLRNTVDSSINDTQNDLQETADPGTIVSTITNAGSESDTTRISFTGHKNKVKNEFSYIASIISKNTRYPPFAEEMEISGTVVLEFIVSKEGIVNDVAIVRSSGYKILDNDAIKTIKISSPFPSSRVAARILFPMEYRLTSAD